MKNIKLTLILDKTNWLEAEWKSEDDIPLETWSFSGHKEHISLLRAIAKEFNTSLKEFEPLIKQCQDAFIYPTDEEIAKEELQHRINESLAYLNKTDKKFFIGYKPKEDEDLVLIEKLRDEAREFIRANK